MDSFDAASKFGVQGIIFTYCYALNQDDDNVRRIIEIVESNGGKVCWVMLNPPLETLEKRVLEEDRKKFRKIKSVKVLHECLGNYELNTPIPFVENLVIDNETVSAEIAAVQIKGHFGL